MIYNEFKLRLPELLLMRVDKIGMSTIDRGARAVSRSRARRVHHGYSRWRDKIRGGVAKYLLKKAVTGLIPDEIINRRKMGFGAPMSAVVARRLR